MPRAVILVPAGGRLPTRKRPAADATARCLPSSGREEKVNYVTSWKDPVGDGNGAGPARQSLGRVMGRDLTRRQLFSLQAMPDPGYT